AVFKSHTEVNLLDEQGKVIDTLTANNIVINTGATPVIQGIQVIQKSKYLYDSTGIMNLNEKPKRLVIVGGGYISLEFASMFANF
ncbi:FAD-dependent oxidoreductase, partial [Staphylococcus aureus]|uniref:FAD-dependent oxidoreductase n=1 Tax=Staphylococcus aureus TaxID=1280 RepID=UPI0038B4191C